MKTEKPQFRYRAYTTVSGEGEVVEVQTRRKKALLNSEGWHASPSEARAALRRILEDECQEAEQRIARRRAWIAANLPEGQ